MANTKEVTGPENIARKSMPPKGRKAGDPGKDPGRSNTGFRQIPLPKRGTSRDQQAGRG